MSVFDALRLAQVKRYGICHVNRDQSVAEHSFMVALIAGELATATGDENLIREVMMYSIIHDMDEIETGDIPSPFKRKLRAECPGVIPILDGAAKTSPEVKAIVKAADLLESLYYIREFGGSRFTQEDVYEDILDNLNRCLSVQFMPPLVMEAAKWLAKNL